MRKNLLLKSRYKDVIDKIDSSSCLFEISDLESYRRATELVAVIRKERFPQRVGVTRDDKLVGIVTEKDLWRPSLECKK